MYNTSSDHINCLTAFNSCDASTSVEKQRICALLMNDTKNDWQVRKTSYAYICIDHYKRSLV